MYVHTHAHTRPAYTLTSHCQQALAATSIRSRRWREYWSVEVWTVVMRGRHVALQTRLGTLAINNSAGGGGTDRQTEGRTASLAASLWTRGLGFQQRHQLLICARRAQYAETIIIEWPSLAVNPAPDRMSSRNWQPAQSVRHLSRSFRITPTGRD